MTSRSFHYSMFDMKGFLKLNCIFCSGNATRWRCWTRLGGCHLILKQPSDSQGCYPPHWRLQVVHQLLLLLPSWRLQCRRTKLGRGPGGSRIMWNFKQSRLKRLVFQFQALYFLLDYNLHPEVWSICQACHSEGRTHQPRTQLDPQDPTCPHLYKAVGIKEWWSQKDDGLYTNESPYFWVNWGYQWTDMFWWLGALLAFDSEVWTAPMSPGGSVVQYNFLHTCHAKTRQFIVGTTLNAQ